MAFLKRNSLEIRNRVWFLTRFLFTKNSKNDKNVSLDESNKPTIGITGFFQWAMVSTNRTSKLNRSDQTDGFDPTVYKNFMTIWLAFVNLKENQKYEIIVYITNYSNQSK